MVHLNCVDKRLTSIVYYCVVTAFLVSTWCSLVHKCLYINFWCASSLGSPAPTSGSPATIPLIAGLTAGVVVGIAGVLICIALFVVFMRRRESSTSLEQPPYDYEVALQLPTLPERIKLEKNDAYGTHPQLTSASPSLQSNVAYGVTERIQMEENDAYNILHSTIPPP